MTTCGDANAAPRRTFDFSLKRYAADLPAPGDYEAVLTEVRAIEKPTVTWLVLTFCFSDTRGRQHETDRILAAACPVGSPYACQAAGGRRDISSLLDAIGCTRRSFDRLDDLTAAIRGARLTVSIAVLEQDGLPTIHIRSYKKLGVRR